MRLEHWSLGLGQPKIKSWKHDPVTGSTIARWLKMCLTEAGINTEISKAHSVRGASSSTAAAAGVTTADILIGHQLGHSKNLSSSNQGFR